jgi:hypothetical protein
MIMMDAPRRAVRLSPAQQHLRFFANFGLLVENHLEWFSPQGDPKFLLMCLVLYEYRDHIYLTKIPVFLQKLLFALLAPLARLNGYRLEVAPSTNPR